MHGKRLKLIFFSTGGSDAKEYSLGWQQISLLFLGFLSVCLIFVFSGLLLFSDVFHDAQNMDLKKRNAELKKMLTAIEDKVDNLKGVVDDIERDDRDLRVFLDMKEPGDDMRRLGRGGHLEPLSFYSKTEDESIQNADRISSLLDDLQGRMNFAKNSRKQIVAKYNETDEAWRRIPSIYPVEGERRITSRFGPRIHPTIGGQQFHDGLDIGAPRGTPVYASAEGKVIKVVHHYRPNHSFGKYVVIDHGNGIQTRYAHLNSINVRQGDKVKRFDQIGRVGSTGRSTAPHLHYEVAVNGKAVNPMHYIFDPMIDEESM